MKIGIIQNPVYKDKDKNLKCAEREICVAAQQGADIVILGEMFNCPYDNQSFVAYAEEEDGESLRRMSKAASENHVFLIAGSISLKEQDNIYNASFVFDKTGRTIACHKKVHLFDIQVKGGQCFRESDTFTAGNQVTVFDTDFGKMGLCICFDFRFPELSRIMTLEGVKCIFVPAAFNMTTGPAHWELLFRQRAVDNQLFTVGVAPARNYEGYVSYANSIVVSPWGKIVFRADEKPVTRVVEIDLKMNDEIRKQLPLLAARRTDLYEIKKI